jgi:phage protein D
MSDALTLVTMARSFRVTVNGATVASDVEKYISTISVVLELNTADQFNITLANPYPDMRWTNADADLFQLGHQVKIEMGYVGAMQAMIDGKIETIATDFPASGTPTLAVGGHSSLGPLRLEQRTRTFQDVTDSDIVQKIAGERNIPCNVTATTTRFTYVLQQNQTDMAFLAARASAINFQFGIEDGSLVFRPATPGANVACSLTWGRSLRSFRTVRDSKQVVGKVVVRGGYDSSNKATFTGQAGDESAGITITKVDLPVASQEDADSQAKSILDNEQGKGIEGSASSVGVPDIRPGRVVQLNGLGDLNGQYLVTAATHNMGGSGYTTNFNVRRTAT